MKNTNGFIVTRNGPLEKQKRDTKRKLIACPVCGENREFSFDHDEIVKHGIPSFYGIDQATYKEWFKGIIHSKHMRIDCYHCYTCDSDFESQPYEVHYNI